MFFPSRKGSSQLWGLLVPRVCVGQWIAQHLEPPGLVLDAWGQGGLGCRKEAVHLVEKRTGGKQVLWPVPGAELEAEPPWRSRNISPRRTLKPSSPGSRPGTCRESQTLEA